MEIRYAVQDDIPQMGRVYVNTWKAAYQGMIPQEFLHDLSAERWEESYRKSLDVEGKPNARKTGEFSGRQVWEIRYTLPL